MRDLGGVVGCISGINRWPCLHLCGRKIEELFAPLSAHSGNILLLSGGEGGCARYSFIFSEPFLTIKAWHKKIEVESAAGRFQSEGDPFDVLGRVMDKLRTENPAWDLPFKAGVAGYFGYDLRYHLEKLPDRSKENVPVPDLYLICPGVTVIFDHLEENYDLVTVDHALAGRVEPAETKLNRFWTRLNEKVAYSEPSRGGVAFSSNFTRESYTAMVERAREYIRQGDIYQVNLSQLFRSKCPVPPYSIFQSLFSRNPAAFYAYLNCGDFSVISTSPERFILREGEKVETRPIKGTRPRGKTLEEDDMLRTELFSSSKEDAELSMIVDLLRNDLGKLCVPGTIEVKEHKRVEAYQNVFHLVSIITGKLKQGCSNVEVLKAVFPGGSITGCPKVRAMEIIEELEPVKRGIYTGSIGYMDFNEVMNLSIAIRTAVCYKGEVYLSVGGGIVYNSEAESEYLETLHKGETFFKLLEGESS